MERNFAAVMSELRHARGLSQRKVAADLKISQALLSHYENGAREPGLAFVCRACDYYGVSADFLLGRVVLRDDDSPRQFGMLKQQAVSELRAIVIRTWLTDMSRGVAATVCKALAGLGYGAHISKKGFALAPLDIAEAWNNLHPDEPPLDIVWD